MCGIIGYQGPKNVKDVLLNGLRTLEYRGYDSAGVAIFHKKQIQQFHTIDSLDDLQEQLKERHFEGRLGIGHTRWATHGRVSIKNAHPHFVDGFSIVHNGIIENHLQIKAQLKASGMDINFETDSKLIAYLLLQAFHGDLLQATLQILPQLKGSYAVLAMSERQPETWVAFKSGPPLVLGVNEAEIVMASDAYPLLSHTNNVIYLQDGEVVQIENAKYQIFDQKGKLVKRQPIKLSQKSDLLNKQGYPHFMLKEVCEQSVVLKKMLSGFLNPSKQTIELVTKEKPSKDTNIKEVPFVVDLDVLREAQRIFIIACGSSYYAGCVGKQLIEHWARLPVEVYLASEFRYGDPLFPPKTVCVFISQSGETADTLAALQLAKEKGQFTIALSNTPHSTIDRLADGHIYMLAGTEVGVASTKTFTSTLAILNIFGFGLKKLRQDTRQGAGCQGNHQGSDHFEQDIYQALNLLPTQVEHVLRNDAAFQQIAGQIKESSGVLYMGRGMNFLIALEGALKLKELAYLPVGAYPAGEMKHGPIALVDEQTTIVVLIPKDHLYEKTKNNLEEMRARGGKIIAITTDTEDNKDLQDIDKAYQILPKAHWTVNPILEAVVVQMIAYHTACLLGRNVDRPRNLAKSVTVE